MDSINKQQPEENRKDLHSREATEKIRELAEKAKSCFFCTRSSAGQAFATRPMSIQKVDDEGNLWFLSSKDSHKNAELQMDPGVQLLFQGSHYSDFLNVYGEATVTDDKQIIKSLWEPMLKTWFTGGVDDPRISAIQVKPSDGYYWDTKNGLAVSFAKQIVGAISGKTLDDSIEGKLKV